MKRWLLITRCLSNQQLKISQFQHESWCGFDSQISLNRAVVLSFVSHLPFPLDTPSRRAIKVTSSLLIIRSGGRHAHHKRFVPTYRSSPHHGKLTKSSPRDDGFRSGMSVFSTCTSEPPAEWGWSSSWDDLSWWSWLKEKEEKKKKANRSDGIYNCRG